MDYPYVSGDFEWEGQVIKNVGIRYKGQASFMFSRDSLKKSFKIDFNRFVNKQKFFGLKKLNLNNNTMDPSQMVEALSYETFREFLIAAPRTAFAKVYLTVPGQFEREYLGLYTVVEQIDDTFLEHNFNQKKGLLLKPRMVRGLPYLGHDWKDYEIPYEPKNDTVEWADANRFMDFAQSVNEATDSVFVQKISEYTDVGQFLRFLAVNAAIANYDSILAMGQNYYIYGEPARQKFLWIPWDVNLALGKFMILSSPSEQMQAAILPPNAAPHPLIERVLAVPEWKDQYLGYVRDFLKEDFQPERIRKNISAIHAAIQGAVKEDATVNYEDYLKCVSSDPIEAGANSFPFGPGPRENRREGRGRGPMGPPMMSFAFSLESWIKGRVESLQQQLDGQSPGIALTMRGPGGPGGFGPGMFLGPQWFTAADADQDGKITAAEWEKNCTECSNAWDTNQDQFLTEEELANGLGQIFRMPEDFPDFGPPGGFSPGMLLLRPLMEKANENGQLSRSDFLNLGKSWRESWDTDHNGELTQDEIATGINQIAGPPPDFFLDGPPGF
ncbi:MAG: CotH kinase family protein [bacterium]